jgi:YegS/Rv2252/BmrU family lipid kinase
VAIDPARTVVVANPAARGGGVARRWDALTASVTRALGPVRFQRTERPGHAGELAQRAVDEGATTVLSLGGDGTHHEVVQGLMRAGSREVALGVLPVGTGGDLRRSLRATSFDAMLAALPTWEARAVDVGRAEYVTDAGEPTARWFINVASCGMGGSIDRAVNASGKAIGALSFLVATLRALGSFAPPRVRVYADGEALGEREVTLVAVCNGRYAGGGMCFAPEAALDDGWLDVVLIEHASAWRSLPDLRHLYAGTLARSARVTTRRAKEVRVEVVAGEALIDLDGESPGRAPVTWRVEPGALRLLG